MKIPFSFESKSINVYVDDDYDVYVDDDYDVSSSQQRINAYAIDEPQTIDWIKSFSKNSIFWDVGSNIGGFSYIASMIHDSIKIYSFEPNFVNYYCQIKTCKENGLGNIHPFNVAINDKNEANNFNYDFVQNGAKGTFGEELKKDLLRSDYSNPFKRGIRHQVLTLGISLDSLFQEFNLEKPNYLKIDVDGNELLVLKGAKSLLSDPTIKQIFIEIDDKIYQNKEIENFMKNYSFKVLKNINVGTQEKPIRMVLYSRA
jgi:FkbM family methyltransferase